MAKALTVALLFIVYILPACAESPQLEQPISRFRVDCTEPTAVAKELMRRAGIRSSVEITWKGDFYAGPRVIFFRNIPLRELLDSVIEMGDCRQTWSVDGDFIRFLPLKGARKPDYVMNKRVGPIEVDDKAEGTFLEKLNNLLPEELHIRVADRQKESRDFPFGFTRAELAEPVHFSFPGGTLRQLADAVARTQPHGYWIFASKEVLNFASEMEAARPPRREPLTFDTDMIVVFDIPVYLGVPTTALIEELKTFDPVRPMTDKELSVMGELWDRAPEDVDTLIKAYWEPSNQPYEGLRAEVVRALGFVHSDKVKSFLLEALAQAPLKNWYLFQRIGGAVADGKGIPEAVPLLRKFAQSEAADERIKKLAQDYVRIIGAKEDM